MKNKFRFWSLILGLLIVIGVSGAYAQKPKSGSLRVEPGNWWTGMASPNLQLLVYGNDIASSDVKISYPGVTLMQTIKVENPNYLFLNLVIADDAQPGKFNIQFIKNKKVVDSYNYELRKRGEGSSQRVGFNASDAIYLIMPDRFANGDASNDDMPGMVEKTDRNAP